MSASTTKFLTLKTRALICENRLNALLAVVTLHH